MTSLALRSICLAALLLASANAGADSASLLTQASGATPARVDYARQQGATISDTSDNKAFTLWWQPSSSAPTAVIVSLHGHASWAFDEFYLWHPYAKTRNYAVLALQWWFGGGDTTSDYYQPSEMYPLVAAILKQKGIAPGQALLHGYSRGSANSYAMAALDSNSANRYFGTVLSNAGGAVSGFPPNDEIAAGKFGALPFSGLKWIMYCGEKDATPDRDGCPAMNKARDWVQKYGATVSLFIDDPNGDHGGFHQNPANVNAALAAFAPSSPYSDAERLYNWGECKYPSLLQPKATSTALFGYWARCYAQSVCIGIRDDTLWFFDGRTVSKLGPVGSFLTGLPASGC
ncbi:hypothetical protein [Chitinimonas sp.]|uniref:hypothetical protein n=1 Tax=Chitinimonas sp. TaxID=1934313 RepID=UPI0035B0F670